VTPKIAEFNTPCAWFLKHSSVGNGATSSSSGQIREAWARGGKIALRPETTAFELQKKAQY
jgi:hypothetical protein